MAKPPEPSRVECPDCGTPIVLLPLKRYATSESVDPSEVFDVQAHGLEALFAIVDDEGVYRCPSCQRQQHLEP